jgi:tetratricopeptide (TPR) repeat protein
MHPTIQNGMRFVPFSGLGTRILREKLVIPLGMIMNNDVSHTLMLLRLLLASFIAVTLAIQTGWANDPFSRNEYALELMNRGDYSKALTQLQDANHNYPYDEVIKSNLATAYVLAGQKLLGKGQFTDAEESFARATELYPDNGEFRLFHGIALTGLKKYDYATTEFERARGTLGENKAYLYHLGRVKYEIGSLGDAVELWEKALVLDPGDASLRSLVEKTRRERAVEDTMSKGYSGRFNLLYDVTAQTAFADDILQVLEEAYNYVGSLLNQYPEARVPVLIYTKKSFKDLINGPEWSGGAYDGKIRLPIGGISHINPAVRAVLFHEYTHVVIFELTRGNCPMWLNEGIAEYVGRTQYANATNVFDKADNKLLSITQLEKQFTGLSTHDAAIAYEQSYSLVNYMISAYGWHKVNDLLRALGKGLKTESAFAEAFQDYSLSYAAIIAEWRISVAKTLPQLKE